MDEIGIDIAGHVPISFADLEDSSFDLIISLSPEAHHKALEFTRTLATRVIYWPTLDPTAVQGTRETILDAYRGVRDGLQTRIKEFLDWHPMGSVRTLRLTGNQPVRRRSATPLGKGAASAFAVAAITPRSVISPVTSRAGVMSKP